MKVATFTESKIGNLKSKLISYGRLVRFSHTVFALPFALSSVALAWPKHPVTLRGLFWILMAMVCARTAAMGFNRLADRKFDALNPRTKNWELPRGLVTVRGAVDSHHRRRCIVRDRCLSAQLDLLCPVARRSDHHIFLLTDEKIHLGITLGSRACSRCRAGGRLVSGGGHTHPDAGVSRPAISGLRRTVLAGGLRYHLFLARSRIRSGAGTLFRSGQVRCGALTANFYALPPLHHRFSRDGGH